MAKKIYLSPSDQIHNAYAYGNTNEAEQCRKIAAACKAALERNGFAVKTDFQDGTNAMYQRVAQSNSWGADLHICIHTNAGGGKGAEAYVIEKTQSRLAAAQPIYDEVRAISPYGSSRGIKTAGYYELRYTTALCVYLEVDFHDNAEIAKWLVNNTGAIGEAICKGVCKTYGVKYIVADQNNTKKTCTITLPVLRKGSTGEAVKTLQRLLRQLQYVNADGKTLLTVDGNFGSNTEAAVKRWQKKHLGGADGICGAKTWNKLLKGQ